MNAPPHPPPARQAARRPATALGVASAIALALVGALGLGGCAARTPIVAPTVEAQPLPPPDPGPYRLRVGDLVAIKFWGNEELDDEQKIRPDGRISMPFIDELQAAGLTPQELDEQLTTAYSGELARPNVTVIVREVAPPTVYVGGEVGAQGAVGWNDGLTLFRAVQQAGGLTVAARPSEVLVIRAIGGGKAVARAVDIRPVMSGEDPNRDLQLAANDVVFVPRTKIRSLNLFIEQYIDGVIPLQNILGGVLLANIADEGSGGSNSSGGQ